MSELPEGRNLRQHSPGGEHPPGFHPSQYWDPQLHKAKGMLLYSRYARQGELVFDIGANVGERTGWFLELGCRVVAVEPQPAMLAHVDGAATRVEAAVGATPGRERFYVCSSSNYLSTLSADYVRQVYEQPGIGGNIYIETTVEVVTLDQLIDRYGEPAFAKIDVEGGEIGVLQGLSRPLKALSFEVHAFDPGKAVACVARLAELGDYSLAYAPLETFELGPWPPREPAIFGDVYAVLRA